MINNNNLKIMIFGDYNELDARNVIIDIIDHEPTVEDRMNFLNRIKKDYGKDNFFYGVQEENLLIERVKVADYNNRLISLNSLSSAYFLALDKESE